MNLTASWQFWALVAAVFAALTAIFAKVGISDIDSDLATFIRTCVIVVVLGAILTAMGKWRHPSRPYPLKTWVFLTLSGTCHRGIVACLFPGSQTGRRGAGGAARQVVDRAGGDLRRAVSWASSSSLMNWFGVVMIGAGAILLAVF
jgi:transporter family protein